MQPEPIIVGQVPDETIEAISTGHNNVWIGLGVVGPYYSSDNVIIGSGEWVPGEGVLHDHNFVLVRDGFEMLRFDRDGVIFIKGREVGQDDDLVQAVHEWSQWLRHQSFGVAK